MSLTRVPTPPHRYSLCRYERHKRIIAHVGLEPTIFSLEVKRSIRFANGLTENLSGSVPLL